MLSMIAPMLGLTHGPAKKAKNEKKHGKAGDALKAALEAHDKGDHATAKKHALVAVNALHRMSVAAPASGGPAPAMPAPSAGGAPC